MKQKHTPPIIAKEFEALYKEQFARVYNYIFYSIRNTADAEDLTADVFARAYVYWNSYDLMKGSRGAWLGGIARNMVRGYIKKKAVKPAAAELTEFLSADIDIEGEAVQRDELRRLFERMDELPERERSLLTMKYLLGLTNREIAKNENMSESNVGVIIHRTILKLRKIFSENM